jgi:RND family efflux transporter MFP subunit
MRRVLFPAGIAILLMSGCNTLENKKPDTVNSVNIRIHPVEYLDYKIPVRATGTLSTSSQMKLSFKSGGLVSKVHVKEGESVKEGKTLAVLDLSEISAHVKQAQIGFEKAKRDMLRARNLYHDSVATLEQYQNARSAYEFARSQKQIADFNLRHSQIKAPLDGKIQKLLVESNEMIAPGYPAILFASTQDEWVVRVSLTDKDIVKLALGDSALVTMDAFPGEKLKAKVTELGAIGNPLTATYLAELMLIKTKPQYRTGFIARAEIYPSVVVEALQIPLMALLDANDHTASVYVYENGKALKRRVRTGLLTNDAIVIIEGLQEGEMVITDGMSYLSDDSELNLVTNQDTIH